MKTYIHIGVDKCGSSSLQSFLSLNGEFLNNENRLIEYKCLTKNGILTSEKIKFLDSIIMNFWHKKLKDVIYILIIFVRFFFNK